MNEQEILRLAAWCRTRFDARSARILGIDALSGGAIQENLALDIELDGGERPGAHRWVLRRDADATIAASHDRPTEHALLEIAWTAGVTVPEPIALCIDPDVLGGPFSLMQFLPGTGFGPAVVKRTELGGDRTALVERLGQELALIHRIDTASPALQVLPPAPANPALGELDALLAATDDLGVARPVLERGLRLARLAAPAPAERCLLHRDFRTGNLLLDPSGLVAVLDWEFAGFGDPMSDLGWFCARCWRFSRPDLEAGGLGSRAAFYRGYEAASGRLVEDARVRWWEAVAHLRWAVIALQQGQRHRSGAEPSLALALTGRMADALERDALAMLCGIPQPERSETPRNGPAEAAQPGTDLLAAARHELTTLIATLPREQALPLRMVARAIAIANGDHHERGARDAALKQVLKRAGAGGEAALVRSIRDGDHDDGAIDPALVTLARRVASATDP